MLKKILEFVVELLFGKRRQTKEYSEISHNEVYDIVSRVFPRAKIYLSDQKYKLISVGKLKEFLAQDKTDEMKYKAERFDCDNFSYRLMGYIQDWNADLAFGIIWITGKNYSHALNCFISNERKFYLVEPQSDAVYEPNNKKYKGWLVIM